MYADVVPAGRCFNWKRNRSAIIRIKLESEVNHDHETNCRVIWTG